MTADTVTVYLSLGSNLGNRQANLDMALKMLSERMRMGKVSSIYDTEPMGNTNQPRFLNLACEVFTHLSPEGLLALTKGIERRMGRYSRSGEPRTIDIDIALYGDQVLGGDVGERGAGLHKIGARANPEARHASSI